MAFPGGTAGNQHLNPQFVVRPDAQTYFVVGRVFLIVDTQTASPNMRRGTTASYGSFLPGSLGLATHQSHRRMVVVRAYHNYCWCLPIHTYSNRATNKPSVDGRTHAVVYTRGRLPVSYEGERMIFDSIMMDPSGPHGVLRDTSRLNFAHIHTVHHNQPVIDLGVISLESFETFQTYWQDVLGGHVW